MHSRRATAAAVAAILLGVTLPLVMPVSPAEAEDGPCGQDATRPGQVIKEVPWQQKVLDPERVWPFATGTGQTVAVIDSGVDGSHPQLSGHVLSGWDMLRRAPDDNLDCVSHGTGVAALIAAQRSDSVGFRGLAPGAKVLPIRVGNTNPAEDPNGPKQPSADTIAGAVRWATGHGATVIDVSTSLTADDNGLHSAVKAALDANIVVVAAVGDQRDATHATDPPTYPAAYAGVLGVGAIDESYQRSANSQIGPYVSIMAPGDSVVSATRIGGYQLFTGTSLAAGLVAASAALVRQAHPDLNQEQVVRRIIATADPAPGGQYGMAYGHGIVDPYRAVSERNSGGSPEAVPGIAKATVDPRAVERDRWWRHTSTVALISAGALGLLLILLFAGAFVLPRGRLLRWRPGRAVQPADGQEKSLDDASEQIFAIPKPHGD